VEGGGYAIPVMPATGAPVMGNADVEDTRRRYYVANTNRAATTNLAILDELVAKRHELGTLMGGSSYAEFALRPNMAKDPATVWAFLVEFRQVPQPSVWHEEVSEYEVFGDGQLVGRFYLDLYPRPNKESWFYGVPLTPGSMTADGYEVPVSMLLGNFTRPTDDRPSLVSHRELSTLFHEFGHIMNGMSYHGDFASQSGSLPDSGKPCHRSSRIGSGTMTSSARSRFTMRPERCYPVQRSTICWLRGA